jgi:hypothetical protein
MRLRWRNNWRYRPVFNLEDVQSRSGGFKTAEQAKRRSETAAPCFSAINSKPERGDWVAREMESAERFVKIFAEGEDLKISAEHFWM